MIRAFAYLKKSAAQANEALDKLDKKRCQTIGKVCDEILKGKLDENFPLAVWQTGSGTQSNMNVNEVIAHRGNELAGEALLHPNDPCEHVPELQRHLPHRHAHCCCLGTGKTPAAGPG